MKLKIDEVAEAVWRKQMAQQEARELAVYMSADFYAQCKAEISGQVSPAAMEFIDRGQLLGFNAYIVYAMQHHSQRAPHVPYRVVEL